MPITCGVCGEDQFDEVDGHFFCTTCLTQTQDLQVEEEDDDAPQAPSRSTVKAPKKEKQKKVVDKGRPWITAEAFQIFIKKQVEALIELGADPKLEEIVFRIWVLYLSKTGQAFTGDPESKKLPLLMKFDYHRDRYPGSLANPSVKPVRYRRTYRKHFGVSVKKAERVIAKKDLAASLGGEEFYEGDNPMDRDDSESASTEDSSEEEEEVEFSESEIDEDNEYENEEKFVEKGKCISQRGARHHIQRMTMVKTLCFCYLGLMYTNNSIMPADIVRWVKRGKIPYLYATRLLPENMKMSSYDFWVFNPTTPRADVIRVTSGRLAYFLGLKDFPVVSMAALISKYILMLDLPAELHGFVLNLMKNKAVKAEFVPTQTVQNLPRYEAKAMAYIIVTLKLLLGLDDHTERQLSECAEELMQMIHRKYELFVWDTWIMHINQKVAKMNKQQFLINPNSGVHKVRDVNAFMEEYHRVAPHQGRHCRSRGRYKEYKVNTRDAMERPLKLLDDKWKENSSQSTSFSEEPTFHPPFLASTSTSFQEEPLHEQTDTATMFSEDADGYIHGHQSNQANSRTVGCLGRDKDSDSSTFRYSSLKYITQPDSFLDELDNKGLTNFTIHSSCLSSSDEEDTHRAASDPSDDEDGCVGADLFLGKAAMQKRTRTGIYRKKKKKNSAKSPSVVKETIRFAVSQRTGERTLTQISNNDKFRSVLQKLVQVHESFVMYDGKVKQSTGTCQYRSYDALLSVCSFMIECDVEELESEVSKLQMVFFGETTELDRGGRKALRILLKQFT